MASQLKLEEILHPTSNNPAITINADDSVTIPTLAINGGTLSPQTGFKNRIINGAMTIAQRGTSFAAASGYTLDRWNINKNAGVVTVTQNADVPSNNEFQNSLRVEVTTADTSIAAGDIFKIDQRIEGYNISDLVGQTFTASFWVRSSKTGIHCVSFGNNVDRSYVVEYTVNAANTWEFKTITVIGGIVNAGTWNFTNGVGCVVSFALAAGTNFQTTADAWQTGNLFATANQVNCLDTIGNIFSITGVTLEKGSTATPFEFRSIGQELALCQRYYYRTTYNSNFVSLGVGIVNTTTSAAQIVFPLPVTMRSAPTINYNAVTIYDGAITASVTSISTQSSSTTSGSVNFAATGGGLVVGRPGIIIHNNSSGYLDASSEL